MSASWTNLPEDVKRIIVGPLNRLEKAVLRQCSWSDKLFIDSISKPIREINFIAHRGFISIRYDEEFEDHFERENDSTVVRRSKNFLPFTSFHVNDDFQTVAWRSFRNMLKSQNNEIESLNLSFIASFDWSGVWKEPERIIPNLPEDTVSVKNLEVSGDSSNEMTNRIVRFVKPEIDYLNIWVTNKDLSIVSLLGDSKHLKTAKKLASSLQITFEQSMELEGNEIINKTSKLSKENIVELLKKSLTTGKPSKFTYAGFYIEPKNIVSFFESVPWSLETSKEFENIPHLDLALKNFILSIPNCPNRIFVEIQKFQISGFIMKQ